MSANNLALCSMYAGSLSGGIQSLETSFMAAPERLMQVGYWESCAGVSEEGGGGVTSVTVSHREVRA